MSADRVRTIHQGSVVRLNLEYVTLPNGNQTDLEIVRHPGASAIVPLTEAGTVLLVRQYRHAASGYILEVPAGKLDSGEDPAVCAERELEEEAGVRAGRLHKLGHILTTPGFSDEVIHLYLATQLTRGTQALEHDEVLSVEEVAFSEALRRCRTGDIIDAKSVCALMLAAAHLEHTP
jgi:ADP-ribose pyrophosphatase